MNGQGPSRGRILIADDDEAFRLATRLFLRRQGFACEVAPDAAVAAEMLRTSEFDLLISDINMPGNAGLELVTRLAQVAVALPVILLTGHPSIQSAARSVRLRVVAYLVKPCDADELLNIAEQAIANYRAYRAVSANRQRLETWARDLAQIEEVLRTAPGGSVGPPTEAYLNLTLRNLLSVLMDLKQFTEALAHQPGKEGLLQQVALHRALQETIEVLEKTKQSFKSKELGELRRRLESLLQTPPTGGMETGL
jgi:DNA-binding response OmpR family regulator